MRSKVITSLFATPLLAASMLCAQDFGGARLVQQPERVQVSSTRGATLLPVTHRRYVKKRRSKKKSAIIVGGSALGGAAVGGLIGGKKGAAVGALAGAGTGYVYDRKSQQKPIIPK